MFMDSVGEVFRQDMAGMAHFCSMMSEAPGGRFRFCHGCIGILGL